MRNNEQLKITLAVTHCYRPIMTAKGVKKQAAQNINKCDSTHATVRAS